jgi:chromate transporter
MLGFILPSTVMMIGLAILYRHLRHLPDTDRVFHGLNAAVVALILVTAWRLGTNALSKRWQWWVGALAFMAVAFFHATVIEVVLGSGLIGIYIESFAERQFHRLRRISTFASRRQKAIRDRLVAQRRARRIGRRKQNFVGGYLMRAMAEKRVRLATEKNAASRQVVDADLAEGADDAGHPPLNRLSSVALLGIGIPVIAKLGLLATLTIVFLRMGAITFGGGLAMIPSIESEVVQNQHWLTHQEFADATALGQITPGPVLVTATFIGYRVAGTLGALVATFSIFFPAFLMTIAAGSSLRRFRANKLVQSFLRGITPAVVGLLAASALTIGRAGIHSFVGLSIAAIAAFLLVRFRPNAFWVILGAGALRYLIGFVLW